jgi:hypothetical protein
MSPLPRPKRYHDSKCARPPALSTKTPVRQSDSPAHLPPPCPSCTRRWRPPRTERSHGCLRKPERSNLGLGSHLRSSAVWGHTFALRARSNLGLGSHLRSSAVWGHTFALRARAGTISVWGHTFALRGHRLVVASVSSGRISVWGHTFALRGHRLVVASGSWSWGHTFAPS